MAARRPVTVQSVPSADPEVRVAKARAATVAQATAAWAAAPLAAKLSQPLRPATVRQVAQGVMPMAATPGLTMLPTRLPAGSRMPLGFLS